MLPLWVIVSVKATMATLFINTLQGFACGGSRLAVFANNGCCSCLVEAQCQQ